MPKLHVRSMSTDGTVLKDHLGRPLSSLGAEVQHAWMRRIVACVCACQYLPTEALRGRVVTAICGEDDIPITLKTVQRSKRRRAPKPVAAPPPSSDALAALVQRLRDEELTALTMRYLGTRRNGTSAGA